MKTGICYNCGAGYGLHQDETLKCPLNGKEETKIYELERQNKCK